MANWAEGALNDLNTIEAAVAHADGEELPRDGALRQAGGLESLFRDGGLEVVAAGIVDVPWRRPTMKPLSPAFCSASLPSVRSSPAWWSRPRSHSGRHPAATGWSTGSVTRSARDTDRMDALTALYQDLHRNPLEASFAEERTAKIAADHLRAAGYEVIEHVGRTGVVGILRNGEGPVVLLRADMAALPVKEVMTLHAEDGTVLGQLTALRPGRAP